MDRDTGPVKKPPPLTSADRLDPAWAHNNYYRDGFRNMMRVVNIQAAIIFILAAFFTFYVKNDVRDDRYFAEAQEQRRLQMTALSLPNMGRTALMSWIVQSTTEIMTFGFNDIDERFSISRRNFTDEGWRSFSKAMKDSKLIDTILRAQQLITAVPVSTPVLMREGIINGAYSWVFETEMLLTFRSGSIKRSLVKTLRVVVEQVPTRANPYGLGISEWYIY